jgi:hypothetical protein
MALRGAILGLTRIFGILMKLTFFALILTLGLLGVTGWLAWDQHADARGARNQLELLQRQRNGGSQNDSAMLSKENEMLLQQIQAAKGAAPAPASLPPPRSVSTTPGSLPPPPASAPLLSSSTSPTMARAIANGHIGAGALDAAPPPLTPRQKIVMSTPAIGRVTEYHEQYGFVVISAGSDKRLEKGMSFAVRRSGSIIARIKVTEVENSTAVCDIASRSVPAGVAVQVGDDVIQDLPPDF